MFLTDRLSNIYESVNKWFLTLLVAGTLMVILNGQNESIESTPIANYFTAITIASVSFYIRKFLKAGLPISKFILFTSSLYFIGVLVVSFLRPSFLAELPRSMVMAVSVWCGLLIGACIGLNRKMIYQFAKILLFFGVSLSVISIITDIGVVSGITNFSFGRSNRLWTTAFGVVDPASMFAAGLVVLQMRKHKFRQKISILIFLSASILLLLFSSTRSFLIQAFIILFVFGISKIHSSFRLLLLALGGIASIYLFLSFSTFLDLISSLPILSQFGFVDSGGEIGLEKSRVLLSNYLIETTFFNPFIGVGMNSIKEFAQQLDGAAKTEYGYALHMASFGVFVAAPFYLSMIVGGLVQPILGIVFMSKKELSEFNAVNGMAIGAFLAGFNGYYGQATSITQFTYLIWIGIAMSLNQSVLRKKKVNQSPCFASKSKKGRLSGYHHDDQVDVD